MSSRSQSNNTAALSMKRGSAYGSSGRVSSDLPPRQEPPRLVGRYLLCDAFAAGGMATVHLGRLMGPEGFSRTVAIKQLHRQFARDPAFVSMFLDEARLASRVRHPNVISPLDVISDPPELFMVMDYVHGDSLSRLLRGRPGEPVSPRIAAAIIGQVLLGLHAAHVATGEHGEPLDLVHRDVSPQNILLASDGVAKVVDFGIAKARARSHHTERGVLKGKLGYMAPEQIDMDAVTCRTDVFAVGVVLWELLTGQRLFGSDAPLSVFERLTETPLERPSSIVPDLPPGLDELVLTALARSPLDRFDSARAMAQALDDTVHSASMLELAAWVESCGGPELSARAELVRDVEGLSFDDFTRAPPHRPPPAPPSVAKIDNHVVPASTPTASEVPKARGRKRNLLILLALVGAAGLSIVLLAQETSPVGASGPSVVWLQPPPRVATAAPQPQPSGSSEQDAPRTDAVTEAPAEVRVATSSSSSTHAPKPPVSTRVKATCSVPYTLDANGVKRFKASCL
jgi:eukaryotic-like serine/threonine-protein kinase